MFLQATNLSLTYTLPPSAKDWSRQDAHSTKHVQACMPWYHGCWWCMPLLCPHTPTACWCTT